MLVVSVRASPPLLPARTFSFLTLHVIVGFAAGHPLSPLETPVVRVRQHYLYEYVVVSGGIESVDVEAQEGKHASVQGNRTRRSDLSRMPESRPALGHAGSEDNAEKSTE